MQTLQARIEEIKLDVIPGLRKYQDLKIDITKIKTKAELHFDDKFAKLLIGVCKKILGELDVLLPVLERLMSKKDKNANISKTIGAMDDIDSSNTEIQKRAGKLGFAMTTGKKRKA